MEDKAASLEAELIRLRGNEQKLYEALRMLFNLLDSLDRLGTTNATISKPKTRCGTRIRNAAFQCGNLHDFRPQGR